MTKFKRRISTAIATGAVLVNALAPISFAQTTLTVSDNGAGSTNTVAVTDTSSQTVTQSNTATVTNNVTSNVNTGNNAANFNTGDGNVTVVSGDASATTTVANALNSNTAVLDCCAQSGASNVTIDGNGAYSNNTAALSQANTTTVAQVNTANVSNAVTNNVSTGYNEAGFNTGDGDVVVASGNASATTHLTTLANANALRISPAANALPNTTSLMITDNGAGSNNVVSVYMPSALTVTQYNTAAVTNAVTNNVETGRNAANFNTGDGDVVIATGNVAATTTIDNMVNFNGADIDCGCVLNGGLMAKISGNGAVPLGFLGNAQNTISAVLGSTELLDQVNSGYLTNLHTGNYNTGYNEAMYATQGDQLGDPAILGGDVVANTSVSNDGNSNVIGSFQLPWSLPEFQMQFDFSGMMHLFGLWM